MKASRTSSFVALLFLAVCGVIAWIVLRPPADHAVHVDAGSADVSFGSSADEAATRLTVLVSEFDGTPVGDASLEVGDRTGTTDSEGVWRADVAAGDFEVTAAKEGYITSGPLAARKEVHLAEGADLQVGLTLRKPGSIAGTVTAEGQPVQARLSLLYVGEEFAVDGAGESGEDGTFSLERVPPGRLRILVETEQDYATTESREIALDDGEEVTDVDIDLSQAGTIAGKVLDADGDPITDADVVAMGERTPRGRRATTTDTGGFRLNHFPAGVARLRVRADGFAEEVVEELQVIPGEVAVVEVTLEQGSGVWGTVKQQDGDPAGAAFVIMRTGGEQDAVVRTRRNGSYRLDVTPRPGSKIVAVSPYRGRSDVAEVEPGARVDLTLGGKGAVKGRVVDAAGNPVEEFEIGVESMEVDEPVPYSARTIRTRDYVSSDGSFEFAPLRPGRYWLRANASGHAPGSAGPVEVRAGSAADELVIELTAGGTVAGKVTGPSGEPLTGANIVVFDPMSPFRTARTRTDAYGRYELEGVPPGRRSLRVARRGYLSAVSSGIEVPAGGEVKRDVRLERKKKGEKFSFHGIGAVLRKRDDGSIEIQQTMEDKPAAIFGLKKGDRITAVDGESTTDMRLGNVVELIRGEEGAAVELTLQRQGEGRVVVEVERGRVVVK